MGRSPLRIDDRLVWGHLATGRDALLRPKKLYGDVIVALRGTDGAEAMLGARALLWVNIVLATLLLCFGVGGLHALLVDVPPSSLLPTRLGCSFAGL